MTLELQDNDSTGDSPARRERTRMFQCPL
jgi:hypothetical protein